MENKKLVAYIRGGFGDIWPALSAIKVIIEEQKISKYDVTLITDNVYYFRKYPKEAERFSHAMLHKITSNVIMVSPHINNNFSIAVNDVTEELSHENADKFSREFMFWRSPRLKQFVMKEIAKYGDKNTIFIDSLFTECIQKWNFQGGHYEPVTDKRATFNFNPPNLEKQFVDALLSRYDKTILIHAKQKKEGNAVTKKNGFYNCIIEWCNLRDIIPIVIGVNVPDLKGDYIDMHGNNKFSFEGMGYLIHNSKVMLGNDSGFSAIKLYQQQKDKLLIMEHARWERSPWYFRAIKDKSNCLLFDGRKKNIDKITKSIGDYYGIK